MVSTASASNIAPVMVIPNIANENRSDTSTQVINTSCHWQDRFLTQLAKNTKQKALLSFNPEETKGRQLSFAAKHSTENTPATKSSPRWMEITGKLSDQEKSIGEFNFFRETYSGSLQDCNTLNDFADDLADDLAEWLKEPVAGVKVGAVIPTLKADTIEPDVEQSCPLTRKFSETLADESDRTIYRVSGDVKAAQGKKLQLQIVSTHLRGGGAYTGSKWIKVVGSLVENNNEIGNFIVLRHSFRGWTSCSMVDRLSEEISKDILEWMKSPMMNAKLGDADATTTAEP